MEAAGTKPSMIKASQNASGMDTLMLATLLCTSAGDFAPGMTHATQSSRSSGNWRAEAMSGTLKRLHTASIWRVRARTSSLAGS